MSDKRESVVKRAKDDVGYTGDAMKHTKRSEAFSEALHVAHDDSVAKLRTGNNIYQSKLRAYQQERLPNFIYGWRGKRKMFADRIFLWKHWIHKLVMNFKYRKF